MKLATSTDPAQPCNYYHLYFYFETMVYLTENVLHLSYSKESKIEFLANLQSPQWKFCLIPYISAPNFSVEIWDLLHEGFQIKRVE